MAKKFMDYYDEDCANLLSKKITRFFHDFQGDTFIQYINTELVNATTFTQRLDLFADAFELYLYGDYEKNIGLFKKFLGPELPKPKGMFTDGWWLWPIGRYVERHGLKNRELTLSFLYELTKRFTGEFAIRPLLIENPKGTMSMMREWSLDPNVHVRRLASEGLRTRLPWAKKTLSALDEFELYAEILTNLNNDPKKFVQKSVGNNLNDLMKDRPDLANQIIDSWKNQALSKHTLWIIKHGMRSLK